MPDRSRKLVSTKTIWWWRTPGISGSGIARLNFAKYTAYNWGDDEDFFEDDVFEDDVFDCFEEACLELFEENIVQDGEL
jgi:hypothetical protein